MVDLDQRIPTRWKANGRLLWLGIPMYCLMLFLILSRFLHQPDWRLFGVAWYAMLQIYAPTLGSAGVLVLVIRELALGRVHWAVGAGLGAAVLVTSAAVLYWSLPLLMSV